LWNLRLKNQLRRLLKTIAISARAAAPLAGSLALTWQEIDLFAAKRPLIVILAQVGSYVPADSRSYRLIDRVSACCTVRRKDDWARGAQRSWYLK